MSQRKEPSYICPRCERPRATYVPRGGDGSAIFFKRHKDTSGQLCEGSWEEATLAEQTK